MFELYFRHKPKVTPSTPCIARIFHPNLPNGNVFTLFHLMGDMKNELTAYTSQLEVWLFLLKAFQNVSVLDLSFEKRIVETPVIASNVKPAL